MVWSNNYVDIEQDSYQIDTKENMIKFLTDILNKAYYSGETLCIESAEMDVNKGEASYTEIDRWK